MFASVAVDPEFFALAADGLADVFPLTFQKEMVNGVQDVALLAVSIWMHVHRVKPLVQQHSTRV